MIDSILDFYYLSRWIDIVAVITGILYVILASRNHILCWPFGIVSSALITYSVCFYMNLYMETVLNAFYVVAGIWGWINWSKQNKTNNKIKSLSVNHHLVIIASGFLMTFLFGFLLGYIPKASSTYLDSFTTIFAFTATIMTAKRILENWFYWIVADLVSIYLYFSRGGEFYVILFTVYIIFSVLGYINWRKEYKESYSE